MDNRGTENSRPRNSTVGEGSPNPGLGVKNSNSSHSIPPVVKEKEGGGSFAKAPPVLSWKEQRLRSYGFKCRYCRIFVERTGDDCWCGRPRPQHPLVQATTNDPTKTTTTAAPGRWTRERNTVLKPTNAFGDIKFAGVSARSAKYIRLDIDSKKEDIVRYLKDDWALSEPDLIIYLDTNFGRTPLDDFTHKKTIRKCSKKFCRGLIKACRASRGWIVTDAVGSRIYDGADVEILEEATMRPVIIGITGWGNVFHKYDFSLDWNEDVKRLWLTAHLNNASTKDIHTRTLDHHHSHFLLVDDGTVGGKVDLGEFRQQLIEKVRESFNKFIPVLKVTFDTFGRVQIEGHSSSQQVVRKVKMCEIRDMNHRILLKTAIRSIGDSSKKQVIKQQEESNKEAGDKFSEAGDSESKETIKFQLRLEACLQWGLYDLADDLLEKLIEHHPKIFYPCVENLFEQSILKDSESFVELTMKHGMDVGTFLTEERLIGLYDDKEYIKAIPDVEKLIDKRMNRNEHFYEPKVHRSKANETKDSKSGHRRKTPDDGKQGDKKTLVDLSEHYRMNKANGPSASIPNSTKRMDETSGVSAEQKSVPSAEPKKNVNRKKWVRPNLNLVVRKPTLIRPVHDLFIWAIMTRKFAVAKHLFLYLDDRTAAALTAVNLIQSLATEGGITKEERDQCLMMAEVYKAWGMEVLERCQTSENLMGIDREEHKTECMLYRRQDYFGGTTCLMLAVMGRCMEFLAHPTSQRVLDKIWRGSISLTCAYWRIMICMLFPPLFILRLGRFQLISFREKNEEVRSVVDVSDTKLSNGNEVHSPQKPKSQVPMDSSNGKMQQHSSESADGIKLNPRAPIRNQEAQKVKSMDDGTQKNVNNPPKERVDSSVQSANDTSTSSRFQNCRSILNVERLSYWGRLREFFAAPVVVYGYHLVLYLAFLALFSHVALSPFSSVTIRLEEIILYVWIVVFFFEEVRQFIQLGRTYFSRNDNKLIQFAIWTYVVSQILRWIPEALDVARTFMFISLIVFYLRLLYMFFTLRKLGPTLIMIKKCLVDLCLFIVLVAVFFTAYGVVFWALMYSSTSNSDGLFYSVLRAAYWPMLGEIGGILEEIQSNGCGIDATGHMVGCSTAKMIAPVVLAVYALFMNILMWNILIALFNYRIQQVYEKSEQIWGYYRYNLIRDFSTRPCLPPPFIIIIHVLQISWYLASKLCKKLRYRWIWDRELYLVLDGTKHRMLEEKLKKFERFNAGSCKYKVPFIVFGFGGGIQASGGSRDGNAEEGRDGGNAEEGRDGESESEPPPQMVYVDPRVKQISEQLHELDSKLKVNDYGRKGNDNCQPQIRSINDSLKNISDILQGGGPCLRHSEALAVGTDRRTAVILDILKTLERRLLYVSRRVTAPKAPEAENSSDLVFENHFNADHETYLTYLENEVREINERSNELLGKLHQPPGLNEPHQPKPDSKSVSRAKTAPASMTRPKTASPRVHTIDSDDCHCQSTKNYKVKKELIECYLDKTPVKTRDLCVTQNELRRLAWKK